MSKKRKAVTISGELVIALVGPVGADLGTVASLLKTRLSAFAYSSQIVRLSDFLKEYSQRDYTRRPADEQLWAAMCRGDWLRARWNRNDALALHAVNYIAVERQRLSDRVVQPQNVAAGLRRNAWILRSLKTPEELSVLRSIYGPRLVCIAAHSPKDARVTYLQRRIEDSRHEPDEETWSYTAQSLIDRDERGEQESGQNLSGTFHQADFFIRADTREHARQDIHRILHIVFGDPFATPTKDEHGQFMASAAAARSAELGRQVGAALVDRSGHVLAIGANEVPKLGGGSYWPDDDGPDNRDFARAGRDTNREHLDQLSERLASALAGQWPKGPSPKKIKKVLRAAGLKDLTEFGRAVHAEMNALLDAARRGVPVQDATVHTTTFPCHNCARHLVGAGVRRVVYIEPYPKSRAATLHDDAIVLDPATEDADHRVVFVPFIGVSPRRYHSAFDAQARQDRGHPPRKDKSGKALAFERRTSLPAFLDVDPQHPHPELPGYRSRELIAIRDLGKLVRKLKKTPLGALPSEQE